MGCQQVFRRHSGLYVASKHGYDIVLQGPQICNYTVDTLHKLPTLKVPYEHVAEQDTHAHLQFSFLSHTFTALTAFLLSAISTALATYEYVCSVQWICLCVPRTYHVVCLTGCGRCPLNIGAGTASRDVAWP